ncbi:ribonuclease J [Ferrovibrio terrae]|uniref:Ribonuclease J n=1 Tax=Ferrovibrio terrae TaxID=2594003 RepID=A0A516H5G4_9PROT|nr:ribonuclease J [Ferrovibrio terrae]QDO98987.1 ribonuclease J [Ferrovibrio terrae]
MSERLDKDSLYFLPLGGVNEIGMNLNLYGYGDQWIMVDLGTSFADEGMPGVDMVVPDVAWIAGRREKLLGLILTHAHEDHLGAISHCWEELQCPVWATGFAASVLRRKLEEKGMVDDVPVHIYQPGDLIELGPFRIRSMNITHSTPESQALAIETPRGTVLHTGDWKLDPRPMLGPQTEIETLRSYGDKGVLALVCDSTNVFSRGTSGSEGEVHDALLPLLRDKTGRIAITTFSSNLARLESLFLVAKDLGRHVCLIGRSLHRFMAAAQENGYLKHVPNQVDEREAGFLPRDKILYICTGCQGEPRGAMARIAFGSHPHVVMSPRDTVVFSSKIIPGNERTLFRLHNELVSRGIEVITEKDAFVHVSGHPSRDELAEMYALVRPQIAVPVHGEPRHLVEHARFAQSLQVPHGIVPRNGDLIRLAPGEPDVVEQVPAGRLAIDGDELIPLQGGTLGVRRKLAFNGAAAVTLVVDDRGKLLADPQVMLAGVVNFEIEDIEDEIAEEIADAIDSLKSSRDDAALEQAAVKAMRSYLRSLTGRKPICQVQIVRMP